MEITKGFLAVDLGLYTQKSLIISDVHIGFEESLNRNGVLVPRDHFPQLLARMDGIFKELWKKKKKIDRIIINGDLKHEFGSISDQEWRLTLKFLDYLLSKCPEVVLVRGNHDRILGPIAAKRGLVVVDSYALDFGKTLFVHGDALPSDDLLLKAQTIVIGHEHASIMLRDGKRIEKYKCFFVGKWKGKRLIVLPSLNLLTEGAALMHESALSPFLAHGREKLSVFIVGDKVYPFGRLSDIESIDRK